MEANCKVVYKLDDKGGAVFAELWNPEAEYTDEYVVMPLKSSYDSNEDFEEDMNFANVEGSTNDPKPFSSSETWISFYKLKTGLKSSDSVKCCAINNEIYNPGNDAKINGEVRICNYKYDYFSCGGSICGGHVLVGTKISAEVPIGDFVYLLPICNNHNICSLRSDGKKWGAGYYMKLKEDTTALKLKNYLQARQLQALLNEAGINT
jgi:hypothetical protein